MLDVPLYDPVPRSLDLAQYPEIEQVNHGWTNVNFTLAIRLIAIEIPANWTALQSRILAKPSNGATSRTASSRHYIGRQQGNYVITGVGRRGERRYLIAEQATDGLWATLGGRRIVNGNCQRSIVAQQDHTDQNITGFSRILREEKTMKHN